LRQATDFVRKPIDRTQGRSMVVSSRGIVASEHPLASQAGAMVLADGGHAVDAAIAANAVMGVVAPMMNGVGGDLFAIVYDASAGSVHGVNASGWAPAGLTRELITATGADAMPQRSIHAVTVPGAVAGWALLHDRFGRRPFAGLFTAAIGIAEEGFPVPEITAEEWSGGEAALRIESEACRTYLPGDRAPRLGEVFRNRDLAATLRQIAADGRDAFYAGDIARKILRCSERRGGTMTAADLSEFTAEWADPVSTMYRGWQVYELPPNGQGIAALIMLNVLSEFPLQHYGHNSAEALHCLIEAKKLAYADMIRYVADPKATRVPVKEMLSPAYGRQRARLVRPDVAADSVAPGVFASHGGDTTYLTVVDRHGNMVSLIQSIFAVFGSGIVAEGTGFVLQNRGGLFSLNPDHPNVLAPRKRPLHTIMPGFMSRGDMRIAFGIMGGWNQAQAHVQFISNIADHGMNIQAAIEAARFTKLTFGGRDLIVEAGIPEQVRAALAAKGHELDEHGRFSNLAGGGQSVMRNVAAGVNYGASDPRKDGAALPEPLRPN
jgi:gamma-glutamyltranspeptidase/glutathione hydrolase